MTGTPIFESLMLFTGKVNGTGFQQLNKHLMTSHKNLFSLRNMFGAFFGYDLYSSIKNLIPSLVDTSQKLGAMESRFRAVSTSARAGADELSWVAGQSRRLGLDFLNTADNYSIFFATLKNSMGQGQTRQIFEQWSEAFRVLHVPKEQQSRVLYALREMSSKGKIYMQDLALQLGNSVPDAMGLAAKSMGYTGVNATNRFRQAIKDGKIDVKEFLKVFSMMVNKTYVDANKLAEAMNKPDAQLQTMAANWQLFQIAMTKAGFEKDLVKFLKFINVILPKLEKHAHGIYKILKLIVSTIFVLISAGAISRAFGMASAILKMARNVGILNAALLLTDKSLKGLATSKGGQMLLALLGGAKYAKGGFWTTVIIALGVLLNWLVLKFNPTFWDDFMLGFERLKSEIRMLIMSLKNEFPWLFNFFDKDEKDKENKKNPKVPDEAAIKRPTEMYSTPKMVPKKTNFWQPVGLGPAQYTYKTNIPKIDNSIHITTSGGSAEEISKAIKPHQDDLLDKMKVIFGKGIGNSRVPSNMPYLPA